MLSGRFQISTAFIKTGIEVDHITCFFACASHGETGLGSKGVRVIACLLDVHGVGIGSAYASRLRGLQALLSLSSSASAMVHRGYLRGLRLEALHAAVGWLWTCSGLAGAS